MVRKISSVRKAIKPKSNAGLKSKKSQGTKATDSSQKKRQLNRLERHMAQCEAELQIVNAIQEKLASRLDFQAIIDLVGEQIRAITKASSVFVALSDTTSKIISWPYCFHNHERIESPAGPVSRNMIRRLFHATKPLNLRTEQEILAYGAIPEEGSTVGKSFLGIPFTVGNAMLGVVSIHAIERARAFTAADERLLQTLANAMSVALEKARLFAETQRLFKAQQQHNVELQVINSVQEGLASKLEMKAIYQLVGEKISEIFTADTTFIATYEQGNQYVDPQYYVEKGQAHVLRKPLLFGAGLYSQVIQSRQSLLVGTTEEQKQLGALRVPSPDSDEDLNQSFLGVPIVLRENITGVVSVQSYRKNAYTETDLRLLTTLANSMSVALENARLFDETQRLLKETEQRAEELATVNAVGTALAGELDLNVLIELVGEQVRSVFKADIAFVALLDRENGIINFPYQYGERHDPIQWGQGLTSRIIQTGKPLLINQDMDRQRRQMGVTLIGKGAQSFLGVPIFVGGQSIGVVSVQSTRQEGLFSENDQRLLSTIAANVGIAFQNARLFDETQRLFQAERRAHEQTETLRSVAQALNRSLSLMEVFNLVLTEIQNVIPYDNAGIYQVHDNRRVFVTGHGFSNVKDLVGVSFEFNQHEDEIGYLISQSLQPLILDDALESYPQYFSTGSHAVTKIRSYMAVPIVLNQKLIGLITLGRDEPRFYTDGHAGLATAFAAQAATAIENARLWEQEKLLRKALERELEIGREIQAGFLPEALPVVEGWEIAATLMSAREVAGDFYDAFELPDGKIGLVIADVCDKGVGAALFMTLFRSLIRVTSNQEYFEHNGNSSTSPSIAERLQHSMLLTNNYIAETHKGSGMFATLFFGILDPQDGRLLYANGGHEPPLIVRSGRVRETLCKTGPAVGAIHNSHFEVRGAQLNPGELFFAFTDGAPESKDPRGDFFGRERVLDLVRAHRGSAQALIDYIGAELHHYMDGATQFDDITLLSVKRRPSRRGRSKQKGIGRGRAPARKRSGSPKANP